VLTVALNEERALEMAAAYCAARLAPDPMLDASPDPTEVAEYLATGVRLLASLTEPQHIALVRCHRASHDDLHAKALVTVHDHSLAVFQMRGRVKWHTRLARHSVIDLQMAQDEGHRSVVTWCPDCGDGHQLSLRWLRRAPRIAVSDRTFLVPATWEPGIPDEMFDPEDPTGCHYEGDLPFTDAWYRNVAFARVIGTLDFPLLVMSEWFRPIRYLEAFGDTPAHRKHAGQLWGGASRFAQWELAEHLDTIAPAPASALSAFRGEMSRP
jgi:hypothetical protein